MTVKEICNEVYAAFVAKAQKQIAAGDTGTKAADIGNDFISIGQPWTTALGDDGKINDEESTRIKEAFAIVIDKRVPEVKGVAVTFIYEGFTLFGFGFKGLKYYLNQWFDLGL